MDGKLNCSMSAENAAFTKIRHLENQVKETIEQVEQLGDKVLENTNVLDDHITQIQEKVETENVDTTTLNADTVDAVNVISDNVNTIGITATTIDAETINVDNLENVNVLHGVTVDVEKTIATIGQFTETQTITANNTTTNTSEINVDGETNLTGQVNIDGNVTFTKDNGLSKLQGNYLEIDAANVVIDNKSAKEYALYVPGVNGDALFGGSVAVQDTLAAKNLIVTEETFIKNLQLDEGTVLNNPVLENITETQELTDKALDIDENGKLIRKFVGGGSAGTIANALSANETRYNYEVLDKYKPAEHNSVYHVVLSDTAAFTFYPSLNANAYLENSNGQKYEFENSQMSGMYLTYFGIAHKNIFYIVIPTFDAAFENIISAELRKINMNNMSLEYSIDVSEYFTGSLETTVQKIAWLYEMNGNILSEDKPVLPIINTNKYIDLVSGNILTRDQNFIADHTYYLSKTDTWYELPGNLTNDIFWCTNNKYTSIEDAALIDTPYLDENDNYIFDAPFLGILEGIVKWTNNGVINELSVGGKGFFYRDENNNKIIISPGKIYFNDDEFSTSLYNNYSYVVNKYINITPYQVEKVKIDKTQADFTDVPITAETITIGDIETSTIDAEVVKAVDAEIGGMFFYEGEWYHKSMSSKTELLDFIKNNTEDKNFKILFEGNYLSFYDTDFPEAISSPDITGTYQVYKKTEDLDTSLSFNGEDTLLWYGYSLFDAVQFYNFNAETNYKNTQNTECLHLNNCRFDIINRENVSSYNSQINCENMNNVEIYTGEFASPLSIDLSNCTNVNISRINTPNGPISNVDVRISHCDRCYVYVKADEIVYKQGGAGGNVVIKDNNGVKTQVQPTLL